VDKAAQVVLVAQVVQVGKWEPADILVCLAQVVKAEQVVTLDPLVLVVKKGTLVDPQVQTVLVDFQAQVEHQV
jgi:hypothetical protein